MDNSRDKINSSSRHGAGGGVCVLTRQGKKAKGNFGQDQTSSEKARAVRTGEEERIWKEVKGNKI